MKTLGDEPDGMLNWIGVEGKGIWVGTVAEFDTAVAGEITVFKLLG